jgi:hypothetical protein
MISRPDAEELIDETLTHFPDAVEVQLDLLEALQPVGEALGLRSRDEPFPHFEQAHAHGGPSEGRHVLIDRVPSEYFGEYARGHDKTSKLLLIVHPKS